jgi:hypothetical protein
MADELSQPEVLADITHVLLEAVAMTVHDPAHPFLLKLRMWSAQQPDPAEFRMLMLESLVMHFAATLTDVAGREGALEVVGNQSRLNLALRLERSVFGRDVAKDGWS